VAAEVDLPQDLPPTRLARKDLNRMDRAAAMLLIALHDALAETGWQTVGNDVAMVVGTTSGGMTLGQEFYRQAIHPPHSRTKQARRVLHYQFQRQLLGMANAFGLSGPVTIIANACASSANAIGHAFELVRSGRASRVITGGYDALCELVFVGFDSLQALSTTQCRPFDVHRDGLALGEGAAVLALETLEAARDRGATIIGEILGYGASTDTHHLTQPHPDGDAALASMQEACRCANVTAADIDYINAHGTGTPLNDSSEARAIARWAGAETGRLHVSSTKASVGHLLGAAGAVEAAACLMALREQWVPPTASLETPDPACQFQVTSKPQQMRIRRALSNSFGFGGANATLIFGRWS
jgi:3-oxoacyl-[acyl-carrier-protein] synthase II